MRPKTIISAGAEGIEPSPLVLETSILPLNYAPEARRSLLRLRLQGMLAARLAEFLKRKLLLHLLLIALRMPNNLLALAATKLHHVFLNHTHSACLKIFYISPLLSR